MCQQEKLGLVIPLKNMKLKVSSSVINFREKAERIWKLQRYVSPRDIFKPVVFFGMYHYLDYLHFILHRGRKVIFWCGSDILNLTPFWAKRFKRGKHYCENKIEQDKLFKLEIKAQVSSSFLEDINDFPITYKWQERPQVFLTTHINREYEYGFNIVLDIAKKVPECDFHFYGTGRMTLAYKSAYKSGTSILARPGGRIIPKNVFFHGKVSNEQFNEDIKYYHCGLRLNEFDGCSEIMVKSILLGQYPITRIKYPMVDSYETEEELIRLLIGLKDKVKPNYATRQWWINSLNNYEEF
mgnify:CR=1 FL=1